MFWGSVGFTSRLLPKTGVDALPDIMREAGGRPHAVGSDQSKRNEREAATQTEGDALERWEQEQLEEAMGNLAELLVDGSEETELELSVGMLWGALKMAAILALAGEERHARAAPGVIQGFT